MITDEKHNETVRNMRNRTTRLDREGDYWTESEKESLCHSFNAGEGITDIAICLQRTEPAVMQQIEKMDLYERKANPTRNRYPKKKCKCHCATCEIDERSCPFHITAKQRKSVS